MGVRARINSIRAWIAEKLIQLAEVVSGFDIDMRIQVTIYAEAFVDIEEDEIFLFDVRAEDDILMTHRGDKKIPAIRIEIVDAWLEI